jgi:hypothetical protein
MGVHVFGVRHHGPGSARSVCAALGSLSPDLVLVEGPPDAHTVLPLVGRAEMRPPVALMIYATDAPERACFYPFAVFSPEWQALRYAAERGIPARFMDLPQAHQLAPPQGEAAGAEAPAEDDDAAGDGPDGDAGPAAAAGPDAPNDPAAALRDDPIGALARAAGYSERELWWEHHIEQRRDPAGLFEGILEAMTALRQGQEPRDRREAQREAFMRKTIRTAEREGFARIAVVCGAWHAPALAGRRPAKDDDALLRALPKIKVEATWIPWTHSHLASRSGYGAGIASPGWYAHLWEGKEPSAVRWLSRVAQLLRDEDIEASSASVIEAVRLADALAGMRDLSMPGLAELNEAAHAVLCHGSDAPLALVRERLEIGHDLGDVPDDAPAVPLARDLAAKQKRLRLKPASEAKALDLDLRNENDRARSRMFHQLGVLGVTWAQPERVAGKTGTFHERWQLAWKPELAIAIAQASIFGNTLETAAAAKIAHEAGPPAELPALTALLDRAILAELPAAIDTVLERVQAQAAVSTDVRHLMQALPPLARAARYGSVRETPTEHLVAVLDGLFARVVVGLAGACASLDDAAASDMLEGIAGVEESLTLLDREAPRAEWRTVLRALVGRDGVHGLVRGGCCRQLVEQRVIDGPELERLARLALSPVAPALQAAAWAEGLLRGSALVLLHQDGLWRALDEWLTKLSGDAFATLVPLVRRAFADFSSAERRAMGEKIKTLGAPSEGRTPARTPGEAALDPDRVRRVVPVLAHLLGVQSDDES